MRTMQPSVTIGSYTWAQDRLPARRIRIRLAELRAAMERHSLAGRSGLWRRS